MSDDLTVKRSTELAEHRVQPSPTDKKQLRVAKQTSVLAQSVIKSFGHVIEHATIEPRPFFTAKRH